LKRLFLRNVEILTEGETKDKMEYGKAKQRKKLSETIKGLKFSDNP